MNSMFSNLDELRKNGWIQTQPPSDEVIMKCCCMKISVLCVFLLNAHYLVSMAKWLKHCALVVWIRACYGVHCIVSQCRGQFVESRLSSSTIGLGVLVWSCSNCNHFMVWNLKSSASLGSFLLRIKCKIIPPLFSK